MTEPRRYTLDPSGRTEHLHGPLFSMKGVTAGPRLVVTAPEALARHLSERFWDLPSLVQMRGSLVVRAHGQDPVFDRPDFVYGLPDLPENDAYYQVLGRMTELGMITGRGVPIGHAA